MSEWQGFDQRKVCPNCGDYQTHFGKHKRSAGPPRQIFVLLVLTILLLLIFVGLVIGGHIPKPYQVLGLLLTGLVGLGNFLFNQKFKQALRKYDTTSQKPRDSEGKNKGSSRDQMNQENQGVYHLECWSCGYKWEMTAEEWEQAGKEK